MSQNRTQRNEETEDLMEIERNALPPVLGKKQREKLEQRFFAEGYVYTDKKLHLAYQPRDTFVRTVFPDVTPIAIFFRVFTRAMFSNWKGETNQYLRDHNYAPITKILLRRYLGMFIYFCLHPLDLLSDHWKQQNRDPRFLSRHLFNRIHRNRKFHIRAFFASVNVSFRHHINLGSELCIDECQAAYAGSSPVLSFNANKPHKWGHLFYVGGTMLGNRPYIHSVIAKYPGWKRGKPSVLDIVRYIEQLLPAAPVHITTDCFYNTKGVREYLLERPNRRFTMAARSDWLPHVWKTLRFDLADDEWNMALHEPSQAVYVSYSSEKIVNTVSNAFVIADNTPADPEEPPLPYLHYRAKFNVIDLFDRLYYQFPNPHRHTSWRDHFFYVILKMCMVNSWVLFNNVKDGAHVTLHDFMESLADALLSAQ